MHSSKNASALLAAAALALFAGGVAAEARGADTPALDAILGITLGEDLDEVRDKLAGKGLRGGRDTRSGGFKEGWKLDEGEYGYIAYKTDRSNRIKWISGFYPPGEGVPFAALGDLDKADRVTDNQVIWNVARADGGYRLVAKGQRGRASVVYLLSLEDH